MYTMDLPEFIVSIQKEEVISAQGSFSVEIVRDLLIFLPQNLIVIGLMGAKSNRKMKLSKGFC